MDCTLPKGSAPRRHHMSTIMRRGWMKQQGALGQRFGYLEIIPDPTVIDPNACHFKYPVIAGCWWFQISKYLQCMLIPYLLGHCVMSSIGICTSFFFHHFAATTMEPNAMALKPAEYGEKVAEPIISRFFPDFQSPQMLCGCVVQVQMARG